MMKKFSTTLITSSLIAMVLLKIIDDQQLCAAENVAKAKPPSTRPSLRVPAKEPAEALKSIQLQNGFRAELVAAEPLVTDPVAMKYDENGLAYVVEMNDYPYSDKSHDRPWAEQTSEPIGRIRVLEDTDGDGTFDKSTVFADKLSWPTGIALWKGGVYVTATPDVWYLKDTDGDHRADVRRKVFTGFRKFNVQAVINNLQWGLDHQIYAAGASNSGNVRSGDQKDDQQQVPLVRLGRNDFRFDPRTEQFEVIAGGARFGNTFDDWGNRFLCNIRNPVQHIVLPTRYLRRNPYLPVASAQNDVAKSGDAIAVYRISPPEAWRVINAKRQAADPSKTAPYDSTVATGFVTSSGGVTIYRGAAYPKEFYGNAFIGEVAGNLVMRYKLVPSGVSFEGTRAHDQVEFMASSDNWFRPVNFVNAPDGTLHVLDMYRETIEHPWSMPDDIQELVDLTSGRDRGRIFRLVPPQYPPGFQKPSQPRLGSASIDQLVAELENPNSWWRETAHRLIFERQDNTAEAPLRSLLHQSKTPVARLHALWSLKGLDALSEEDLSFALADADAHVREHAVRLAESRLNESQKLLSKVLAAATDSDVRVRFQAAFTLGETQDKRVTAALANIARRDGVNPWMRTAVLSSLSQSEVPFLLDVLADHEFVANKYGQEMIGQLAFVVGARSEGNNIRQVLAAMSSDSNTTPLKRQMQQLVVTNLGAGLRRARKDLSQWTNDSNSPESRFVAQMLVEAQETALASSAELSNRQQAIRLLGYGRLEVARETLPVLLDSQEPQAIQLVAIDALTSFPNGEVANLLLEKYPVLTPAIQANLVAKLLTRQDWTVSLLDAIKNRKVSASRISQAYRTIFMKSRNLAIRERALQLFASEIPGPRKEVLASYQLVLSLPSDAPSGEKVFQRECLNCHRLGNQGFEVGPNLATIKDRTAADLLTHILDPNREVSPNFLEYVIVTDEGLTYTGAIASETATSITLRQAENKQNTILRANIEEIRSSGKSLMPEGLEKKIKPQEMADLIAFLLRSN